MAWKSPGEFGFRRMAPADAPVRTEDRVRHYRDQVWPKRERFVNQILNAILLASPPAALGFSMPAEWEPHEATWLGWPHNESDWPDTVRITSPRF